MAANGRGTMRANGRSPPFLAIGLVVALCILGFNYWSLSSKNSEQANEIAIIESEIRLVNAKKSSAEKRAEAVSDKIKELEDELQKQKSSLATKMNENAALHQEVSKLRLADKQEELELKACVQEKAVADDSLSSCHGELATLQNKPLECTESTCGNYILASRQATLDDIVKVSSLAILQPLHNAGGNVGSYTDQVAQLPPSAFLQLLQQQQPQQPRAGQDNQQPLAGHYNQQPRAGQDIQQPQAGQDNQQPLAGQDNQQPLAGQDNLQPRVGGDNLQPQVGVDRKQSQEGEDSQRPQLGLDNMHIANKEEQENPKSGANQQSQNEPDLDIVHQIPIPKVNQPDEDDADNAESPNAQVDGVGDRFDGKGPVDKKDDDYTYGGDDDGDDLPHRHPGHRGADTNALRKDREPDDDVLVDPKNDVDEDEDNVNELRQEDNTFEEMKKKLENNHL